MSREKIKKDKSSKINLLRPVRRVYCGNQQGGDWAFFTHGKCEERPGHTGKHRKAVEWTSYGSGPSEPTGWVLW